MADRIDGLVNGSQNPETDNRLVVASGEGELKRGQLLKLDDGKLKKIATGDTPHSILRAGVDATDGDAPCSYYIKGAFNESFIDYGDGTADEFREKLRAVGIDTFEPNR